MAKLRSEAQSVKEQLSASNLVKLEVRGSIELNFGINFTIITQMDALHEGKDFKASVKRDFFEEKSASLFELAPALVSTVIEQAGLKPEDVAAIEYFGGGVRVPKRMFASNIIFIILIFNEKNTV